MNIRDREFFWPDWEDPKYRGIGMETGIARRRVERSFVETSRRATPRRTETINGRDRFIHRWIRVEVGEEED